MVDEKQMSAVLSEFARTLVTDFPIQGILDHLVKRITNILSVTSAGVTLITPGAKPRYIAASDAAALRYEALQTEVREGPCLAAYRTGEPVAVPDLAADARFRIFGPRAVAVGLRAVFTFPLGQGDVLLGALDLYRETPGALSADDMQAAQTLADVAAAYLTNTKIRADAQAAAAHFQQSALHDVLTGLPNRRLLGQRVEHAVKRSQRSQNPSAVLFVDLDHFKLVNDAHGHQVGDHLLVAVAERLAAVLRPGDTLARVSGDEFVILCEDLQQTSDVETLANRIDQAFSVPFQLPGLQLSITASVGIAFAGQGDDMSEQLMTDADTAMYQAKRSGGAGHQVLDLREASRANGWRELQSELGQALKASQLQVFYQPVVRSSDGAVTCVEALLRWTHPTRGRIPPETMILMAEHLGLIGELGCWVLTQACRDRQQWLRAGADTALKVAVNVSATQLMAPGFCDEVAEVLRATGTEPHALVLEMTEAVFIEDRDRATEVFAELKDLGVIVALDDFGTGYTSLSRLRSFPVDILKIDQSFLVNLVGDDVGTMFLTAVTDLAHALGLSVTAEGVETKQQADVVAAVGCESSQGFFYARPAPANQIAELIRTDHVPHLPLVTIAAPD